MSGASLYTGSGFWSAEGHPLVIEYSAAVLERIRTEVIEGFNRTGAGGFEVGGVLFGTFERGVVRILAHRPFACEYAMGPAFALSERDLPRFEGLLRSPDSEPGIEGLTAVGWYHSHTRHGIYLSERDLEIHNRYFSWDESIALVLRPDVFGSVRAGFFFRERDGSVRGDSSYCEFEVVPPLRSAGFEFPEVHGPGLPHLPSLPGLGIEEDELRPARRGFPWVALLTALVIALAAAAAALYYGLLLPRPTMALEVRDLGGPVRISWDRNSRPIANARTGYLAIIDGQEKAEMRFDPAKLHEGSVIYTPQSPVLDVRLRVEREPGDAQEEYVRFVGTRGSDERRIPAPVAIPERTAEAPPLAIEPATNATPPPAQLDNVLPAAAVAKPQNEEARAVAPKLTARAQEQRSMPKPEQRTHVAQFRPPAQMARTPSAASTLPPLPSIRPTGSHVGQNPAPVMGGEPGPPPPQLPPRERPKPVYTGPSRGRLIWTGEVRSNVPISITGRTASYGSVSGELPGVPVRIQVHPADLTSRGLEVFTLDRTYRDSSAVEAPGPQNGWNPAVYKYNEKRARSVTVTETPSPANGWKGLMLRGDIDWTPVIIIDWQVIPQ